MKSLFLFIFPCPRISLIRLDADVLVWLKRSGPGYQTRINALLRKPCTPPPVILSEATDPASIATSRNSM